MSKQAPSQQIEDEIPFLSNDFLNFLFEFWRTIFGMGFIGLMGAVGFVVLMPSVYEAIALIEVAQISSSSNDDFSTSNVEEPQLLITRFKLPTTYSEATIKACGLSTEKISIKSISKIVKFSGIKGSNTAVELNIRMDSRELASSCALTIFENIRESHNQTILPYIEGVNRLIGKHQERLNEIQKLTSQADRDEFRFLTGEIARLRNYIDLNYPREARLIAPIFASEEPIFPNKMFALVGGIFIGLTFGLLLAMGRNAWINYKSSQK